MPFAADFIFQAHCDIEACRGRGWRQAAPPPGELSCLPLLLLCTRVATLRGLAAGVQRCCGFLLGCLLVRSGVSHQPWHTPFPSVNLQQFRSTLPVLRQLMRIKLPTHSRRTRPCFAQGRQGGHHGVPNHARQANAHVHTIVSQANWKLDPALRKACKADVSELCAAADTASNEEGKVYKVRRPPLYLLRWSFPYCSCLGKQGVKPVGRLRAAADTAARGRCYLTSSAWPVNAPYIICISFTISRSA